MRSVPRTTGLFLARLSAGMRDEAAGASVLFSFRKDMVNVRTSSHDCFFFTSQMVHSENTDWWKGKRFNPKSNGLRDQGRTVSNFQFGVVRIRGRGPHLVDEGRR